MAIVSSVLYLMAIVSSVLYLMAIVSSVLRVTASDYSFGIFKLVFHIDWTIYNECICTLFI